MEPLSILNKLYSSFFKSNENRQEETLEERQERIKKQFNLCHGKGIRKRKRKKKGRNVK